MLAQNQTFNHGLWEVQTTKGNEAAVQLHGYNLQWLSYMKKKNLVMFCTDLTSSVSESYVWSHLTSSSNYTFETSACSPFTTNALYLTVWVLWLWCVWFSLTGSQCRPTVFDGEKGSLSPARWVPVQGQVYWTLVFAACPSERYSIWQFSSW